MVEYAAQDAKLPTLAWAVDLGARVGAPALVADGRVYVGDESGRMSCLSLDNGSTLWSYAGDGSALRGGALLTAGRLVFMSDAGIVQALDAGDGKPAWQFKTGGEKAKDIWDYNSSTPATDGERVFVGSSDGHVRALNPADGSLLWDSAAGGAVRAPLLFHDGRLHAATMAGEMLALDAADGSVVWRFKTAGEPPYFPTGEVLFRPVVAAGNLIFGCRDFRFYGVTATDGRLKWAIWATGWSTSIAADSDTAYGCTSDSHLVYAIDAGSGELKWRSPCPINVFCDPALAGDLLLVGAMNGRLYAYDKARGELRWTFRTQGSLDSEGKILTPWGDWQPEVRARNNSSFPELLASYEALYAEGAILSGPVVGGSRVVFGSSDGRVYALELGN